MNKHLSRGAGIWLKGTGQAVLAAVLVALLYFLLRLPTRHLPLAYYDDGETLYHTLSILLGQVPHRDDFNHHFSGYLLPFVVSARLFGFSIELMRIVPMITQVMTGLGVFLCLRFFTGPLLSFLGAALAISAREPWVLGFYPQYQINPFWVFSLFFSLFYLERRKTIFLQAAFLMCGLAFTFDQRALFLTLIPVSALALRLKDLGRGLGPLGLACLTAFALPAIAGLVYLAANGALLPFWEQTLVFPALYRSGAQSWIDLLSQWVMSHRFLFTQTPILAVGAVGGFCILWRDTRSSRPRDRMLRRLLLLTAVPLAIMPFFGARDFDYYTATWLPYMGILAALAAASPGKLPRTPAMAIRLFLAMAVIFPLYQSLRSRNDYQQAALRGDGMADVVQFLRDNMQPRDTLYVWGYRFDPYIYLQKPAALPFASQIFVHPDVEIKGRPARQKHIYPEYDRIFTTLLHNQPPDYLVLFDRGEEKKDFSPADAKVLALVQDRYDLVFRTQRRDFLDKEVFFKIYRLRSRDQGTSVPRGG